MNTAATGLARLSTPQRKLLDTWLGGCRLLADHSWPLQSTAVLELETPSGPVIAKASIGEQQDHHFTREVDGYTQLGDAMGADAPQLMHVDSRARVLVMQRLPGQMAQGSDWEFDVEVYRSAGRLLAKLHSAAQPRTHDVISDIADVVERWLRRGEHLIAASQAAEVRRRMQEVRTDSAVVTPTHGDFQPRNWLVDPHDRDSRGTPRVMLIDFGRFRFRNWTSDLVRLHHQVFVDRADLARAMFDGAGVSADEPFAASDRDCWRAEHLVQSVGTIVWAHEVGDEPFSQQGYRMLERTLDGWDQL